ncbi:unnamed protein product [Parajaminaea phylloscopi]
MADLNPYFEWPAAASLSPPSSSSSSRRFSQPRLTASRPSRRRGSQSPTSVRRSGKSTLAQSIKQGAATGGPRSVCVLDTNTLLSAHAFLASLFKLVLELALSSVSHGTPPPPFVILVPHAVLTELDGLKTASCRSSSSSAGSGSRRNVAGKARAATRWLLEAVKDQRKSLLPSNESLPKHRMPLLVQTREQAQEMAVQDDSATVDDTLVHICHTLQRETSLPVLFCSNDNNARTRAESEGVRTFDLKTVLRCSSSRRKGAAGRSTQASMWTAGDEATDVDESASSELPRLLVEQWAAQTDESHITLNDLHVEQAALLSDDVRLLASDDDVSFDDAPTPEMTDSMDIDEQLHQAQGWSDAPILPTSPASPASAVHDSPFCNNPITPFPPSANGSRSPPERQRRTSPVTYSPAPSRTREPPPRLDANPTSPRRRIVSFRTQAPLKGLRSTADSMWAAPTTQSSR